MQVAESQTIWDAMKAKHLRGSFVIYADEGHGLFQASNRFHFLQMTEQFLAQCLNGKVQSPPIQYDLHPDTIIFE